MTSRVRVVLITSLLIFAAVSVCGYFVNGWETWAPQHLENHNYYRLVFASRLLGAAVAVGLILLFAVGVSVFRHRHG
jgi:hypothetical protein